MSMSKAEVGKQRMKEILGENLVKMLMDNYDKHSPDLGRYGLEFAYGEIYSRKKLNDKTLEVAAVSCLIGQGNTGIPLKLHIKGMLNVGWTKQDVMELIIFLVVYSGFPQAVNAFYTAKEVFEEMESK